MTETGWSAGARAAARAASALRGGQLGRVTSRAGTFVRDPQRLARLVEDATRKSREPQAGRLGESLEELKALLRMALAYARGDYREVPRDKLLLTVGAILYFLSPLDLLPDVLGVLGITDDALVLAFVLRQVHEEVEHFLAWEAANDPALLPAVEVLDIQPEGDRQPGG